MCVGCLGVCCAGLGSYTTPLRHRLVPAVRPLFALRRGLQNGYRGMVLGNAGTSGIPDCRAV